MISRDIAPDEVQGLRIYLLGGFRVMVGQCTLRVDELHRARARDGCGQSSAGADSSDDAHRERGQWENTSGNTNCYSPFREIH